MRLCGATPESWPLTAIETPDVVFETRILPSSGAVPPTVLSGESMKIPEPSKLAISKPSIMLPGAVGATISPSAGPFIRVPLISTRAGSPRKLDSVVPSISTGAVIWGNSLSGLIVNVPVAGLYPGSDFGMLKTIELGVPVLESTARIASRSVPPVVGRSSVVVTSAVTPDSRIRGSSRSPQAWQAARVFRVFLPFRRAHGHCLTDLRKWRRATGVTQSHSIQSIDPIDFRSSIRHFYRLARVGSPMSRASLLKRGAKIDCLVRMGCVA